MLMIGVLLHSLNFGYVDSFRNQRALKSTGSKI